MNNLREIKKVIYLLKMRYGSKIEIYYRDGEASQNLETGAVSRPYSSIAIKRALVTEAKYLNDFKYSLSFIAANKNFTYGGIYDTSERSFIIDAKDLQNHVPSVDDYIVYNNSRYSLEKIKIPDHGLTYEILAKAKV